MFGHICALLIKGAGTSSHASCTRLALCTRLQIYSTIYSTTACPSSCTFRQLSTTAVLAKGNKGKKLSQRNGKTSQLNIAKGEAIGNSGQEAKSLGFEGEISEEQRNVMELVLNREENVFFTGPAGTGKSFLLKKIIEGLQIKHREDSKYSIAITASTGNAAYGIHGVTLHGFAGIGRGEAPTEKLIGEILRNRKVKLKRWIKTKVLIIDEISMVNCTLFNKLDNIARVVRGNNRPFGGIQLIITGDFFQLPPVLEGRDDGSPRFCFESRAWKVGIQHTIRLTQVYRQKDPLFAEMLNEIREGRLSPNTISTFRGLSRPLSSRIKNVTEATELFPLRSQADAANDSRIEEIESPVHTFDAIDAMTKPGIAINKNLLNNSMAPKALKLKQGAQVMLIKNIDKDLVNGSLGRVIGFADGETFSHSRRNDEDQDKHVIQSFTLDSHQQHGVDLYPVVRFQLANGGTCTRLCMRMEWTVDRCVPDPSNNGNWDIERLGSRIQVPLILAWALSIHKSQGQTLDMVKVDLGRVFETGQAYVALSRATSIDGLQVLNFDPSKVRVHPKVKAFYASLHAIPIKK